jgi:hypothetical protein
LNFDDRLELADPHGESFDLAVQPSILGEQGVVGRRFGPSAFGRQASQNSRIALLSPGVQVRRVKSLPPQQRTELAWLRTTLRLTEDTHFVLGREPRRTTKRNCSSRSGV